MYCSKCGVQNSDQAKFCGHCGSPLLNNAYGAAPTVKRGGRSRIVLVVVLAACTVLAVGVFVWALLWRPAAPSDYLPRKDSVAIFCDDPQIMLGKEDAVRMRVRVPKGSEGVTIENESGVVVASFSSQDLTEGEDGNLWVEASVPIENNDPGVSHFEARLVPSAAEVVNISPGGRDIQLYNGMMIIGHSFYAPQGGHFEEWFELTFDLESFQLVDGRSLGTTYVHQLP